VKAQRAAYRAEALESAAVSETARAPTAGSYWESASRAEWLLELKLARAWVSASPLQMATDLELVTVLELASVSASRLARVKASVLGVVLA